MDSSWQLPDKKEMQTSSSSSSGTSARATRAGSGAGMGLEVRPSHQEGRMVTLSEISLRSSSSTLFLKAPALENILLSFL